MEKAERKAKARKRNQKLKNGAALNKELPSSVHVPYSRHVDSSTITTFDGVLIKVIKLEGFSFGTADQKLINRRQEKRNTLIYGMSDDRYALWSTIIRRSETRFPKGDFVSGFAADLNRDYEQVVTKKVMYTNDLYITIIRKGAENKINRFSDFLKSLSQAGDIQAQKRAQKEALRELEEVTEKVLSNFSDYEPHLLAIKESNQGLVSEPLTFFSYLINSCPRPVLLPRQAINQYLPKARPFFGKDAIELKSPSGSKLIAGLTIKEYSGHTRPSILDKLLTLPFEYVLTQSFTFSDRKTSLDRMRVQQRQLEQAGDDAISLIDELLDGMDDLASGRISFGEHHFTLLCSAENQRQLQKNLALADSLLADEGITAVREDIALEAAFWAQLPSNRAYIGRKAGISSQNFAAFSSFHNYPSGQIDGNHWGNAVTLLETVSGTPYYFNFHLGDLGNTTVIGPSGTGKTVLMTFLQAQLEKYNVRRVYLDKDRGAEIFIRAIGGTYATIEPGTKTGFNPFQLEETPANITFLIDLVSFMLTENNQPLTAVDMSHVTRLIQGNFNLDRKDRKIVNLAPYLPQGTDNHLALRFKRWYGAGDLAWLFDNDEDLFPKDARTVGYDLTHILDEPIARAGALRYMFHRIDQMIDGTPMSIVIDEGWAGLEDPYVSQKVFNWEKVIRKQNGQMIFGSQSARDLADTRIGTTIIEQSPTQIFYPNPDADRASHCEAFSLTDKEFDLIKNELDSNDRTFLIKHGRHSVVAKLNLKGMDDALAVLSGRESTVRLLDEIRAEAGDDPAIWLPIFHKKRKEQSQC